MSHASCQGMCTHEVSIAMFVLLVAKHAWKAQLHNARVSHHHLGSAHVRANRFADC